MIASETAPSRSRLCWSCLVLQSRDREGAVVSTVQDISHSVCRTTLDFSPRGCFAWGGGTRETGGRKSISNFVTAFITEERLRLFRNRQNLAGTALRVHVKSLGAGQQIHVVGKSGCVAGKQIVAGFQSVEQKLPVGIGS